MAAKSSSQGSATASEICVYIQDDNHDKENTEDQDILEKVSSEESVNSQELEETLQKKKRITKCSLLKKGNAARSSNGLILCLIEEYEAWPCLWEAILVFTFLCRKSLELAACVTLHVRLPVNYSIINYHKLLWPFEHVNDDDSLERILTRA